MTLANIYSIVSVYHRRAGICFVKNEPCVYLEVLRRDGKRQEFLAKTSAVYHKMTLGMALKKAQLTSTQSYYHYKFLFENLVRLVFYLPFFLVKVHAKRTQLMLSGGPLSMFATLLDLCRIPSTASFSPCPSPPALLSRLARGGGRGGRLFLLSDFELRSTWNSPPEPSVFMVNVMGVPVVTGVVTELADDDGDSATAEKKKKKKKDKYT